MQTENTSSEENHSDLLTSPVFSEKSDEEALTDLSRAGINIGQGIAYCGDKEGFREIIGIYYKEGQKRSRQLERFYEEQDWKNYVITVHALKSNSKGIGANELSEIALQLEMAGKENRIEYIREHHEELLEKYGLLLRVLGDNDFIRQEEPEHKLQEISEQSLKEQLEMLREKLDSYESEGLPELLEQLGNSRCGAADLSRLAEEIREKADEFDFPGAADILDSWEKDAENTGQRAERLV